MVVLSDYLDIRYYSIKNGELLKKEPGYLGNIMVSNNNKFIVKELHGEINVYDFETGELIYNIKDTTGTSFEMKFTSDDKKMVTVGHEGSVILWDLETGKYLFTLYYYDGLYDVAFSSNGKLAAFVGCDMMVNIWNAENGRKLKLLHHKDEIHTVAFSPDGKYIAAGGYDSDIIYGVLNRFHYVYNDRKISDPK